MHSKKNTNKRSHHPEQINTLALLNTCVSSEEHNIYKKYKIIYCQNFITFQNKTNGTSNA